jgi:hypothetical protein
MNMKNKIIALVTLISISLPAFANLPELTKLPNMPQINSFKEAKQQASLRQDLLKFKNQIQETNIELDDFTNFKAKKKGGGLSSLPFIGSYLLYLGTIEYNFDIVDAVLNKYGNGAFEYFIYDNAGNVYDHSTGMVQNFVLTFMTVNVDKSLYNSILINRKYGYGGSGAHLLKIFADSCLDASGDGVVQFDEGYACVFKGENMFADKSLLVRKRTR